MWMWLYKCNFNKEDDHKRNYSDESPKSFNLMSLDMNWDDVKHFKDPNDGCTKFLDMFFSLYNESFPILKIK